MFPKASSSQSSTGFSGSGALSHVYIQYPPLRCAIPEARGLFYDDGNKLLFSPTSDQVISWKTSPFSPLATPASDSVCEGPVLSIRYSIDAKVLAIQRSNYEIQFWDRETGYTFSQKCKSDSESILGFFWTDCPTCDIVFVKTSGLDLFFLDSELMSLHLVETKRFNVSWYVYTHESRLVLLASGMQCKSFTGYQLSAAGIIRLPRFEMAMAKSEANSKPVLAAEDVHVVTVYGRIYCLQVDKVAMLLNSYRFYRDAVVQQGSLPIFSSKIAVSVVDNVLLVHQVDAKVVILYDIFSDSRAPISAPLPLLLRGFPRSITASSQSSSRNAEGSEAIDLSDTEAIIYGDGWTFLVPDLICDAANGLLWKIHLDLEAISASSSEVPSVLEFLQRRKLEAHKAKQLCLAMSRTIILERRPVSMVARAIDILVISYSYSIKTGSYLKEMKAEKSSPSGVPQVNSPSTIADDSASRVDAYGKSVKHESASGVHNESMNKFSTFSGSDSGDNVTIEPLKTSSGDLYSLGGNVESKILMGAEVPSDTVQSGLQSQLLGLGNNLLNSNVTNYQESQFTSAAVSPDEIYSFVFAPVEEEMAGDSSYMVSIIIEFLRSVNSEKIKVHPNLYVLTIQLLARNERYAELGLFVINKILEPSKEVALQLLESGRQNIQTRKLGLDMLRQLSLHHDYVVLLVQDGYYLEALRYARKNKVNLIQPSLFLEAAYASNDPQHVAAVLRFFSDFIPGFKSTSDHNSYCRILTEMNSSIAA
ncbi:Colon cancer-associated Mic1-like protein [Actinidia chinensis var. chinensis]|uniref:Colon cancer-associated Mic1-like protein n=1 Tax=Actinidia chinensis var. chinensis TaxID=1590841 RepID=A0A2R6QRQ7_ACTCC|nr:Colon cancer-associated Mic1-like protein [Actinidia chinensis var. chinensis]